jgi:hypothetical protein
MSIPRKLEGSWIRHYLEYTEGQESPEIFHFWVSISLISACLGRKVYLDRGYFNLYPNMYIVLLAESEECAKSTAIRIGIDKILGDEKMEDKPAMFAQKATPQALVETLVEETGVPDANMIVTKNAEVYIHASELSVLLGKREKNTELLTILTDLYDCQDKWAYKTRFKGWEQVCNLCINLIAATTPRWLRESISKDAIGGGFTNRIVFIYVSHTDRSFPNPTHSPEKEELKIKLVHDLSLIRRFKGSYEWGAGAKDWYAEWYEGNAIKLKKSPELYVRRKKDLILKVAMCISASEKDDRIIDIKDLEIAVNAVNKVEEYLPIAIALISSTTMGDDTRSVLEIIRKEIKVNHSDLLQKVWHLIDAKRLGEIIMTLEEAGLVGVTIDITKMGGGARWYEYIGKDKKVSSLDYMHELPEN